MVDSKKLSFKQETTRNIGNQSFEFPLIISALAYQLSKIENSSLQGELYLCAHGAAVVQHPTHPPHSPSLALALRCTHTCTRMARSGSSTLPSTPLPCASPTPPLCRSHARKIKRASYQLSTRPTRTAYAHVTSRTSQAPGVRAQLCLVARRRARARAHCPDSSHACSKEFTWCSLCWAT